MGTGDAIRVGVLKKHEVEEADRVMRLAFGTYLGIPNPMEFMGDREFLKPRWRSEHVKVLAARDGDRLVGSNVLTRWGSFGFFGPLTVHPRYWDRGVAQKLMEKTVRTFDEWGLSHSGLFTFASSAKHVGLYQKFGYWPRYLTAVLVIKPEASQEMLETDGGAELLQSAINQQERREAIEECRELTDRISQGLDLSGELSAVLRQRTGEVVLTRTRGRLDGFAVCLNGAGSEGGEKTCYTKFGAARGGAGAGERFDRLLGACERLAAARGVTLEVGVNLAREDAYRRMRARGFRVTTLGVAMQRPHAEGFNRTDAYVIDDWR